MLVCMWYTELACIQDVWPSGHYGSGRRPCVFRCMHACVRVVYRADVYTACLA